MSLERFDFALAFKPESDIKAVDVGIRLLLQKACGFAAAMDEQPHALFRFRGTSAEARALVLTLKRGGLSLERASSSRTSIVSPEELPSGTDPDAVE